MMENLDIIQPVGRDLKDKKIIKQLTETCTSYRGFHSIDQEMERDIAMQWFVPANKAKIFRGPCLFKESL